jgi:hypothetical protein
LKCNLHPSLRSHGQFLLKKIKFSQVFDCKRHFFRFVSMLTKEKIIFVSIYDLTMPKI